MNFFALPSLFLALLCLATLQVGRAQTLTTLANFVGPNGANPLFAPLAQGTDGNLYGTTQAGGAHQQGTVFKVTPAGTLTTLHSFCGQSCADGAAPFAGLVLGNDGNFYGTTEAGGTNNEGTVFKMTPQGTLTTLHSFNIEDGSNPYAGLVQATDGNFYGTTQSGGAHLLGTVFKMTPRGALTTLHSFNLTDGSSPEAPLIQGTDGNLYSTTYNGGSGGGDAPVRAVFRVSRRTRLRNGARLQAHVRKRRGPRVARARPSAAARVRFPFRPRPGNGRASFLNPQGDR